MQTSKKNIHIIGMGTEGASCLTQESKDRIGRCDILIGANHLLHKVGGIRGEKVPISKDISKALARIRENREKDIVILSSGDPVLYGIADIILKNFPPEDIVITPNISSMQLAFAKIKVSMNGAFITSAHGRELAPIIDSIKRFDKVGIFTSNGDAPAHIARLIKGHLPSSGINIYLCEDLGFDTERITKTDIDSLYNMKVSPLNIIIFVKIFQGESEDTKKVGYEPSVCYSVGIDENRFYYHKGMITKSEVRAIDISKLDIGYSHTVWDIGAGCGSVSIEASMLAKEGAVYAVEHDPAQIKCIEKNCQAFNRDNVHIIQNKAPKGLYELPDPDRIFIGGSSGNLKEILQVCTSKIRPRGKIVLNAVTLQTLTEGVGTLEDMGYDIDVTTVNISKTKDIKGSLYFEARNPVHIISAQVEIYLGRP